MVHAIARCQVDAMLHMLIVVSEVCLCVIVQVPQQTLQQAPLCCGLLPFNPSELNGAQTISWRPYPLVQL